MRKLVFALTAAAAVSLAAPSVSFARDFGGNNGDGSHASGHSGRSMGSARSMNVQRSNSMHMQRSMNMHNFNRHVSNRDMRWNRHADRNLNARNFAAVNTRSSRDRIASNDWRHDRHHRHHRHHRNFAFYFDTPDFYYDDYASYDSCYQYVWTRYGYRYVNTCTSYYYNVY